MREINMKRNIELIGKDIIVSVKNEEGAHIGSCVIAIPYQKDNVLHVTCQTMNLVGHKEEAIARLYAKEISMISGHVVCCICGIHLDDISKDEMEYILEWCNEDVISLKRELAANC